MTMLKKITALAVLLGAVSLGSLLFAQLQVYGPYSCSSGQGTTNTLPVKLPGPFMIQGAVSITYSGYLVIIDNNTTYAFSESTWPYSTQIFSANATITLSASPGGYEEQDSSNVTVSFLVDVTPQSSFMPIITESPTVYTKGSVVVTASGSVEKSPGIAGYQYSIDGTTWTSGSSYTVTQNGTIVYFRAVDNYGLTSTANQITITNIDTTPPTAPTISENPAPGQWTSATATVTCESTDSQSGVAGYQYSLDGTTWTATQSAGYVIGNNGTIYCRALDNVGNVSDVTSFSVTNIDTTPPVITNGPLAIVSGDGATITVTWTASDTISGIEYCKLSYQVPQREPVAVTGITSSGSNYGSVVDISTAGLYGTTPTFSATATNNAGLSYTAQPVSVAIPPEIAMSATVVPFGTGSTMTEQVNQPYMEVDLDFGISPPALEGFTSLTINRTQTNPGIGTITLPSLTIVPSTIPTTISTSSSSPGTTPWKLDSGGKVIYADYIPVASGAGHKSWSYSLSNIYYGTAGLLWEAFINPTSPISLPNNQGSLALSPSTIFDMNGNPSTSSNFTVGASGSVQIELQGSDPDQDSWSVEIDKITQANEPTSAGGIYTFTSYASLSGATKIPYPFPYANTMVPVTLSYGDNNIQVSWTEGNDPTVVYSAVYDLALTQSYGVYSLRITDGYGNQVSDTATGITCQPGQPLVFSVSASDESDIADIAWNFGDGGTGQGANAMHTYQQQVGQTQYFCTDTLTLTLPTIPVTSVPLQVKVQDTQEGELWEPEIWRGNHSVIGVVIVPQTMNLHIATNATEPTETVSFQGDLGGGYLQGITVNGALTVDGGVTLQEASGQTQGWGAIVVEGSATIGSASGTGVTIQNADRAIAVDTSATSVSLVNTTLTNNATGLQVLGTTQVTVSGCTISGNTVYGIKEDRSASGSGGRPTVQNSTIQGNFRDYYQWDGGLINITQINHLGTNSGNQGE